MSGEWSELAERVAKRFEVAAQFGMNAVHNPDGAKAIAGLLREMGRKLDIAVERELAEKPDAAMEQAIEPASLDVEP